MKNREVIEDSLNFCKDIEYYEKDEKGLLFDTKNYPNLKDYINWMDTTDASVAKDYEKFEEVMARNERFASQIVEEPEDILAPKTASKGMLSFLIELFLCVAISIGVVFLVTNFVVTHTKVIGHSMETTLKDGEYLLIDRLSYQFSDPKQYDIIVFQHTDSEKYIKRVIAGPNQTVQIVDGNIYVNGEVLNENYGNEIIEEPGLAAKPIRLGEDEYFVLGDNRNNSTDSRSISVGVINRDKIQGKVLLRFYPFNKFGTVD